MGHALQRYLAAAPTFLALLKPETREGEAAWLGGRDHALWLAFDGDKAVGYMRSEPSYDDAAYVITDPKTLSIAGAYLLEPYRRSGVAARLLGRIVDWGRRHGYERCAVDFEAANLEGRRFWQRHFQPFGYSLIRYSDERVAWANGSRVGK